MAVRIRASNGRLQLVLSWQGRRQYLSLGYADTPANRAIAALKVAQIEKDILFERFQGLSQYKAEEPPAPAKAMGLEELWELYADSKRATCKPSTMATDYRFNGQIIAKCPHGIDSPEKVRAWILKKYSAVMAQRCIGALVAMGEWVVTMHYIEANPFEGMRVKRSKRVKEDVNPFTAEERDRIIAEFAQHHPHYLGLVQLLFYTGCRPSEALALEWAEVKNDALVLQQGVTLNEQGQRRRSTGLKTQDSRKVPINARLRSVLDNQPKDGALVFPGVRGGYIHWGNFRRSHWVPVLKACNIEYRKPYNMRHTFATLALQGGISVVDLAKIMGNSPGIIYKHYAGASRVLLLPEV